MRTSKFIGIAFLLIVAFGGGASAKDETRSLAGLPADRCPGYLDAFKEHGVASAESLQRRLMDSGEYICKNGLKKLKEASEKMMRYGRNPNCFSHPDYYRAYQLWAKKFEKYDGAAAIDKTVKEECERAAEKKRGRNPQPAETPATPSEGEAVCRSDVVGHKEQCVQISQNGQMTYTAYTDCDGTVLVAIGTFNSIGECTREVATIRRGFNHAIISVTKPRIIDAIPGGTLKTLNCYSARHNGNRC